MAKLTSDVLKIQRLSKKEKERKTLYEFLKFILTSPLRIESVESPDFFIYLPSTKIGVEIIDYHNDSTVIGSSERRRFQTWFKIASKLQTELNIVGLINLYGVVSFRKQIYKELWTINKNEFIKRVVNLCKKEINKNKIKNFNLNISYDDFLSKTVDSIFISRLNKSNDILWWCSHLQTGKVPDPTFIIPKQVRRKVLLGEKYEWHNARGKWLIIVANAFGIFDSGFIKDINHLKEIKIKKQNIYDHIYYWDRFSEQIWEIYPTKRIVVDPSVRSIYVSRLPQYIPAYRPPRQP